MRIRIVFLLIVNFFFTPVYLRATTYFVDSKTGNDLSSGTSPFHPWKSLKMVNESHYSPGDRILFRCGSRWKGQLSLKSSGAKGAPIVIDWFGTGPLPRIDGDGRVVDVVRLENVQEVEVHHLELTNHGTDQGLRRGLLVSVTNFGTANHIVVSDLYIHDVNGTNGRKDNGGILFRTVGERVPSRFDGLRIERNIIWKVDRSAIAGHSDQVARSKWFPSLHVVIQDNYVEDIGGDGIVPIATDGALIKHNIALHCNNRAGSYNAGIWPWSTDNSLFELNEAAYTHSTRDGEGFDSDFNSRNTHFLYNYSHDNDGGFMLICTPGKRDPRENFGNTGTLIERNISRNDHNRIFNLSGAAQTKIEENAIYTAPMDDVQVLLVSNWGGWASGAIFRNNIFDVAGTAHYGHELYRDDDGKYAIAPGWGGARDIKFEGNRYFGRNIDLPLDSKATIDRDYHAENLDWDEPTFNPAHPERFSEYMMEHRQWMIRLFTKQFGQLPHLGE